MTTVLLGWEMGGGLGHVRPLAAVAGGLAAAGLRPVLAVPNPAAAAGLPFPVVRAPTHRPPAGRPGFRAATFADVLAVRGFADPVVLGGLVAEWDRLVRETGAAAVVCDFAPALCVAAYRRLPTVLVDDGFPSPPAAAAAFPPLDPAARPRVPAERLLESVRAVQRDRGRPCPPTLPAAFAGDARFVNTLPPLDPYRRFRTTERVGPLEPLPPQASGAGRGLFAYLRADYPGLPVLLGGLAGAGVGGTVVLPNATAAGREQVRRLTGFAVPDAPPPLADALPAAAVVLHHAGAGVTAAALSAGRPQVMLPMNLEQELIGRAAEGLGGGRCLVGMQPLDAVVTAVKSADAAAATRAAAGFRAVTPTLPDVVEAVRRLARG